MPSECIHTLWLFPHFVVLQPEFQMDSIKILFHWPSHLLRNVCKLIKNKKLKCINKVFNPFVMANLNMFRSKNVLKSHKFHGLTLCVIIVFTFFFLTTSSLYNTNTIICKFPRSSSEFRRPIQGRFPMLRKEGHLLVYGGKKQTLNIPMSMVRLWIELLDGVLIHPVTRKIQASFLTQLQERKETAQGLHHEANGDFKIVTEMNGCDRKLRMDQQHCRYSTILT